MFKLTVSCRERHLDSKDFWQLVSEEKYPKLKYFALRFCSLMGRTYICESSFSVVNHVKSKTQSRLDSQMLSACVRLALTEIPVSDGSIGEGYKIFLERK